MDDPYQLLVTGATFDEFMKSLTHAIQAVPADVGVRLRDIEKAYFGIHGFKGMYARMNNRTVSQILSEYEPREIEPIATGQKDNLRWKLYGDPERNESQQERAPGHAASTENVRILAKNIPGLIRALVEQGRRLSIENQVRLREIQRNYFQRLGYARGFQRLNDRTVAQIFAEFNPEDDETIAPEEAGPPRPVVPATISQGILSFNADFASQDVDVNIVFAGVRGEGHYLVFQWSLDATEAKDIYLEYDRQDYASFGAISRCALERERLTITLSRQLGDLQGVNEFSIPLKVDDESFKEFRDGLTKVFSAAPESLSAQPATLRCC